MFSKKEGGFAEIIMTPEDNICLKKDLYVFYKIDYGTAKIVWFSPDLMKEIKGSESYISLDSKYQKMSIDFPEDCLEKSSNSVVFSHVKAIIDSVTHLFEVIENNKTAVYSKREQIGVYLECIEEYSAVYHKELLIEKYKNEI